MYKGFYYINIYIYTTMFSEIFYFILVTFTNNNNSNNNNNIEKGNTIWCDTVVIK